MPTSTAPETGPTLPSVTAAVGNAPARTRADHHGDRAVSRDQKGEGIAASTYRKHVTFTKQLGAFADRQGYVLLEQFRPDDIDTFYTESTLGPRAKGKWLEWLRSFFQYAVNREWLLKTPVSRDLKAPKGATRAANKVPFTDEQLADIIQACDHVEFRERWGNRWGTGSRTGEDLKDFIWVLTYTGLRIR